MKTRITELLGIKHPIIQGAMSWVSFPPLVAAVSNAGGLGILGAAFMSPEELQESIRNDIDTAGHRQCKDTCRRRGGIGMRAGWLPPWHWVPRVYQWAVDLSSQKKPLYRPMSKHTSLNGMKTKPS